MAVRLSKVQAERDRYLLKSRFRDYQRKAMEFADGKDHVAFIMAPRLGKTLISWARAGDRWRTKRIKRWLIICPSIAKPVWEQEGQKHSTMPYRLTIIEGKADERKALIRYKTRPVGKLDILVVNHEATWRLRRWILRWCEHLPSMCTLDESHKIKRASAKQSRMAYSIAKKTDLRDMLTGTLINKPEDNFAQYRFLDDSIFGSVLRSGYHRDPSEYDIEPFMDRYVATWGYKGLKPETWHRLDEMNAKMAPVTFFMDRKAAGGFPEEQDQDIPFNLTPPASRHYREMSDKLTTLVRSQEVNAKIILTQGLRLQQITGGFLPITTVRDVDQLELLTENVALGRDKLRVLEGVLEEYDRTEGLVIYARFRYEMDSIIELVKKLGRSCGLIAGARGRALNDREQVRQQFQAGRLDTVVIQIRAGISIELSRADTGIFYSGTSSWIDYEQCRSRIIARTGGKKAFVHLTARIDGQPTVDDFMLTTVREREDLVKILTRAHGQT